MYTAVRYFIAFALYNDPIRHRISLALGISCFLAFVTLILLALRTLVPTNLRHLLPLKALTRQAVPYLASLLQVGPAIVNLVFVFIWRNTELFGRCDWDLDVVWRGQTGQCPGALPWGVWLAGGIARLVITMAVLVGVPFSSCVHAISANHARLFQVIYHITDYLLQTTRRPSSMIMGANTGGSPGEVSKRKPPLSMSSSSTAPPFPVSSEPPVARSFSLNRLWRGDRSDRVAEDVRSHSDATRGRNQMGMVEERPRVISSRTAVDGLPVHAPILRQSSSRTAVNSGIIEEVYEVPETRDIPDDASWVSVTMALRPVSGSSERRGERVSSHSGHHSHTSSNDHGTSAPTSIAHGGAASEPPTPGSASASGHGQLSEEDLAGFAERFRTLVDQLSLDVESGMRLDSPDSEPATPPLHNLLDTHIPYMTMDEFGRPVPSDIRIPVLGRYIRRMPTIESIGSGEGRTSPTLSMPSRPPTRATILSFAASMSDHFPSPPPSRSNSINRPAPTGSVSNGQSIRTNSTNASPIRTRAPSITEQAVDLSRDSSGASNNSGASKTSSAKTSTGSTASFHTAQAPATTSSGSTGTRASEGLGRSRSGSLAAQAAVDALTPVAELGESSRTPVHSDSEGAIFFSPPITDSPARTASPASSHRSLATGSTMANQLNEAIEAELDPSAASGVSGSDPDATVRVSRDTSGSFGFGFWR